MYTFREDMAKVVALANEYRFEEAFSVLSAYDWPYGFQQNLSQLATRIQSYQEKTTKRPSLAAQRQKTELRIRMIDFTSDALADSRIPRKKKVDDHRHQIAISFKRRDLGGESAQLENLKISLYVDRVKQHDFYDREINVLWLEQRKYSIKIVANADTELNPHVPPPAGTQDLSDHYSTENTSFFSLEESIIFHGPTDRIEFGFESKKPLFGNPRYNLYLNAF